MLRQSHHRLLVTTILAGALSSFGISPAAAQDNATTAAGQGNQAEPQDIVVTGRYQFLDADTRGATNLPLPIEQVPQSISIVSQDFIKAADLKTLGDIASYTAGAIDAGNPTNNGTLIKIRGFSAGRAIDGINAISTFTSYEPDFAVFDRLEIVEGPSSVVYGVSSPGGLVNYITKGAKRGTPSYFYAQAGSWDSFRLEGQVAGSLDSAGRVRAIGLAVHDQGDSFTNDLFHRRTTVYGGIDADLSDTVSGYVHAGYERDVRPPFDGILTEADGTPAPVSRSLFLGSKHIRLDTSAWFATGSLTWKPSDPLELNLKGNFENATITGGSAYAYGLQANGDANFTINKYDGVRTRNYGVGGSAIVHLDTLGLKDSFISVGALYQDSHQYTNVLYPESDGTLNIFDGQRAIEDAFDDLYAGALPYSYAALIDAKTFTVSGQSVTKFFDRLTLLLGISYSKPKVDTATNGIPQDYHFPGKVSYRAGLTYEFLPHADAYVSYSESFNPQPSLMVDQRVLPPLSGKQYEAGIKYRPIGGLLLTGAAYRIVEKNVAAYDQTIDGVDYYKPVGEVTHKGFELKALGRISRDWQINAGYAYLDPRVTRDTDPAAVGQTEIYLPKNTFSLYTTYSLKGGPLGGLILGGGIRHIDSVKTSYDHSTIDIPDYTLVDASVGYDRGPWSFQLTIGNIFDKHYYIDNYQTLYYGNVPGTPRNASISVRRTF